MAKKDKKKSQDNTMEESTGSKLVTALIVIVIVAIWLLIFGVLIKLDVGNFGSSVLTPVLKDVPVLNWILPDSGSDDSSQSGEYDNLKEANARIKELESQLATTSNSDNANSSQVQQLQSEVQRLKKFEDNQEAFAKRVKEFDENVVYNELLEQRGVQAVSVQSGNQRPGRYLCENGTGQSSGDLRRNDQ